MQAVQPTKDQVVRLESANQALAHAFLGWQCRLRQIAFRRNEGRPSTGMTPTMFLAGKNQSDGRIITVLNKIPSQSSVMEFRHMYRRTRDPNSRRSDITQFLSESYFQGASSFSDRLTSVFLPGSQLARNLQVAGTCRLEFRQFNQGYWLHCDVLRLAEYDDLFQATFWHNALFNPNLSKESEILVFVPDWKRCSSVPVSR